MFQKLSNLPLKNWLFLLAFFAIVVIASDQYTKQLAASELSYGRPVNVSVIFDLTLLYNYGAAFSFLSDESGWQRWFFTAISLVASIALLIWVVSLKGKERFLAFGLTLVFAGAVGNLIDRVLFGYVIDFLSFHWQRHYFPAFNIADSAISVGAGVIILDMLINKKEQTNDPAGQ